MCCADSTAPEPGQTGSASAAERHPSAKPPPTDLASAGSEPGDGADSKRAREDGSGPSSPVRSGCCCAKQVQGVYHGLSASSGLEPGTAFVCRAVHVLLCIRHIQPIQSEHDQRSVPFCPTGSRNKHLRSAAESIEPSQPFWVTPHGPCRARCRLQSGSRRMISDLGADGRQRHRPQAEQLPVAIMDPQLLVLRLHLACSTQRSDLLRDHDRVKP